ncbi:hypothetical protein CQ13_33940 [Bradyrhizobium retamae]|uniref:Uncharacterized protein n=1 Tax=Bradyrhizobium retamae TaxID=1300035 RepID=A0A0R3MH11_9BRAD|nr:hypothetical protein CQ13_33940 [Bradyrhizobium retamae]
MANEIAEGVFLIGPQFCEAARFAAGPPEFGVDPEVIVQRRNDYMAGARAAFVGDPAVAQAPAGSCEKCDGREG